MNRPVVRLRLILVAVGALLFSACGGGEAPAPTAPAGATLAPATVATTAPTAPSAVSAQLSAAATAAAPATTAAPAATTPPVTSAPLSVSGGSGACDNPYYPLRQGATWTYTVTGLDKPAEQTQTVTKVENGSAEITLQTGTITVKNPVDCTAEGLKFGNLPSITSQTGNLNAELTAVSSEGVYLPRADRLVPGAQWDAHYVLKGKISMAQQAIDVTEDVKLHFEVVGSEKVTVPAGTFDALKIKQHLTIDIQMANAPASVPPGSFDQFVWFARDVGMVKTSVSLPESRDLTTELKSYNIP